MKKQILFKLKSKVGTGALEYLPTYLQLGHNNLVSFLKLKFHTSEVMILELTESLLVMQIDKSIVKVHKRTLNPNKYELEFEPANTNITLADFNTINKEITKQLINYASLQSIASKVINHKFKFPVKSIETKRHKLKLYTRVVYDIYCNYIEAELLYCSDELIFSVSRLQNTITNEYRVAWGFLDSMAKIIGQYDSHISYPSVK